MGRYKRPDDMPGRVCRVLEGITLLSEGETIEQLRKLESMVYRFTHIASGLCGNPHEDWRKEFEEVEREIEWAAFTSPAEKAALDTR